MNKQSLMLRNKDLIDKNEIEKLLEKIKELQTKNKLDLSSDEDLSIAIMNLISIEEHMFFSAVKTGKVKYLDLLNVVRQMRTNLLKRIIKDYEGEAWCISKHLLAATMRLNEVGTKLLKNDKKDEAWDIFRMAYQLYSLFWGINLGVIKSKELKRKIVDFGFEENEFVNSQSIAEKKGSFLDKLGEVVKRVINCCVE